MLQERLKLIEAKYGKRATPVMKHLPVYYGWAKINRIQKREALTVIFLNDTTGPRIGKDDNDGVTRFMVPVYRRWQTEEEASDALFHNRVYTVYSIFMDDKKVNGSLEAALEANFEADRNHVKESERNIIRQMLRNKYLAEHPDYKEPKKPIQLTFNF